MNLKSFGICGSRTRNRISDCLDDGRTPWLNPALSIEVQAGRTPFLGKHASTPL